jgi:tripartite-type tricarboxylate transporter receptor subunit TctC
MKLLRRQFLHLAAGAAALPAVSRIARAQGYPTRPVRIIVPLAAGGGTDIIARLIGRWLAERLPNIIVVHPSFPAKTISEFIAYAKANPSKINFASGGSGNPSHLAGELLKIMAGVDIVHVPYRGAGPALTDLLGGQVQVMFATLPARCPTPHYSLASSSRFQRNVRYSAIQGRA